MIKYISEILQLLLTIRGEKMDENYLDSLLNEITLDEEIDDKIEDELDEEIVSDSDNNRSDDSIDRHVEEDSRQAVEIKDTVIAREQFDELDELDTFADIDMEGLDFDDIDFDDIDVTNINLSTKQDNISDLEDFEDVNRYRGRGLDTAEAIEAVLLQRNDGYSEEEAVAKMLSLRAKYKEQEMIKEML